LISITDKPLYIPETAENAPLEGFSGIRAKESPGSLRLPGQVVLFLIIRNQS
jgi:hypothetical protein